MLHLTDLTTIESEAMKIKDENIVLKVKVQMLRNEVEELTLLMKVIFGMMIKKFCITRD